MTFISGVPERVQVLVFDFLNLKDFGSFDMACGEKFLRHYLFEHLFQLRGFKFVEHQEVVVSLHFLDWITLRNLSLLYSQVLIFDDDATAIMNRLNNGNQIMSKIKINMSLEKAKRDKMAFPGYFGFEFLFRSMVAHNSDYLIDLTLVANSGVCANVPVEVITSCCNRLEHLELDMIDLRWKKIVTLYQSNPRLNFVNLSTSRGARFSHSVLKNELKLIGCAFLIVEDDQDWMTQFFTEHCRGIEVLTVSQATDRYIQRIAISSKDTLWKVCLWDLSRHHAHDLIEWCPNVKDLELKTTDDDELFSMSKYEEENKYTMVELCEKPTNIRRLAVHGSFFNGPELQMFVDKNLQLGELAIYKDIWTTEKRTKIALSRLMNHISKQNKAQDRTRLRLSNLE
jgi:hypothetical protein